MHQPTITAADKTAAEHTARTPGIVTHTTAFISGPQTAKISVHAAGTDEAQMVVAFGHVMMTFRTAAAVSGVITAFAHVRAVLTGVDARTALPTQSGDDFALPALSIVWLAKPEATTIARNAYSAEQRRTLHWVDLRMGPITWRITDRIGYDTLMSELRTVHRAAVGVFRDGGKFRRDPTVVPDAFEQT
ncbi:hypothetical protein [Rhodococcus sp. KRD197]|uniref:hypothetical protein n=1 Tax=Rhodococcus sp. KRD197 TaxID=2729731 RepID=UPI0019D23D06|nr:hypothetical protein [Rhodococcus sp. KRD197]